MPSLIDQYTLVIGAVLPAAIAVVLQSHWDTRVKTAVSLLLEFIAAAGKQYFLTAHDPNPLLVQSLALAAVTIAFHEGFYKPSGVADAIEKATTIGGAG